MVTVKCWQCNGSSCLAFKHRQSASSIKHKHSDSHVSHNNVAQCCSEYSAGNWLLKGEVVEPLDKTPLMIALESDNLESAHALIDAGKLL